MTYISNLNFWYPRLLIKQFILTSTPGLHNCVYILLCTTYIMKIFSVISFNFIPWGHLYPFNFIINCNCHVFKIFSYQMEQKAIYIIFKIFPLNNHSSFYSWQCFDPWNEFKNVYLLFFCMCIFILGKCRIELCFLCKFHHKYVSYIIW